MVLLFLIQAAAILAVSQFMGKLCPKIGQPKVVGEMIAGILLGPSLLGWLSPGAYQLLFPASSMGTLHLIGQLGLVLFMFLVGLRLDLQELEKKRGAALLVSLSSIILPFASGCLLAWFLHGKLSSPQVPLTSFALFLGVCMSITAFPVLARILHESGLAQTRLGTVAIACAAVDDVSAWLILAAILGFVHSTQGSFPFWGTLLLLGGYVVAMLALRPLWAWLTIGRRPGNLNQCKFATTLLILLASSTATEWLGIHALFGAFFAGVAMPKDRGFIQSLSQSVEPLTATLILPWFFTLTGLRTQLNLAVGGPYLLYTILIIAVAVTGKYLGAMLSARSTGMEMREASALGILMNTRGLVELVILNIGFDLGLLSPAVFSMMVLMALTTTMMATPLLRLILPRRFSLRHDDVLVTAYGPQKEGDGLNTWESLPKVVRSA